MIEWLEHITNASKDCNSLVRRTIFFIELKFTKTWKRRQANHEVNP